MELRKVQYALAVVDHGGFTAAARAMHVAQPSLSQAVRQLERELGAPLFRRSGRSVELTDAGAAFLGPARRMVREAENVVASVGEHAELQVGSVEVVALPTLVASPLTPAVAAFRARHPGVIVRVLDASDPTHLIEMVRDGRAELGLSDAGRTPGGLVRQRLADQELMAVLPPGAVPEGSRMTLAQFARWPLVLGPPMASTRQVLEAALAEAGHRPLLAVETDQRDAIVPLVRSGAGATVLPALLARDASELGAAVAPFSPRLRRPVHLLHPSVGLSPGATELVALLGATRE
jgi:DNA-binding transcriptional LysR family regulator